MTNGGDRLVVGEIAEIRLPVVGSVDPLGEVDVDIAGPDGRELTIPAFRIDHETWAFRFAPQEPGRHVFRPVSRAAEGEVAGGDAAEGEMTVDSRSAETRSDRIPLPIHVDPAGSRFVDAAGEPFLWLGDTWWYALSDRISDAQLARLARQRVAQGFTVVQLVAGLYPEIPPHDPRGNGDGRQAWDRDWTAPDVGWFGVMDRRLRLIMEAGLLPSIVGAWGYYLSAAGVPAMKRHWRELVARYAAYPVTWSIAGEATLPWYDHLFKPEADTLASELATGWLEVARYVRSIDPYRRPMTAHPSPGVAAYSTVDMFDDPDVIDFVMLQTGHWDRASFRASLDTLEREVERRPRRPVLNGEVCYEGILGSNWPDTQRFLFWSHLLSGAAGHTYGAQGLWAFNDGTYVGQMGRWGSATWQEAARLPGAEHLGAARHWLEGMTCASLQPSPDVVEPHASAENRIRPYAATSDDGRRVMYFPGCALVDGDLSKRFTYAVVRLKELEPGQEARVDFIDPRTCEVFESIDRRADADGVIELRNTPICALPSMEDWLVLVTPDRA